MELSIATRLLQKGVDVTIKEPAWADLGAGSGLFTKALSSLLSSGIIYAVDKDNTSFINNDQTSARIQKAKQDFTKELAIEQCDGILMANSLHYVSDKQIFIHKIKQKLKKTGVMIVIEYERSNANPWVPYPIKFHELEKLMIATGFSSVQKIEETPSSFDRSMIYSALVRQ